MLHISRNSIIATNFRAEKLPRQLFTTENWQNEYFVGPADQTYI